MSMENDGCHRVPTRSRAPSGIPKTPTAEGQPVPSEQKRSPFTKSAAPVLSAKKPTPMQSSHVSPQTAERAHLIEKFNFENFAYSKNSNSTTSKLPVISRPAQTRVEVSATAPLQRPVTPVPAQTRVEDIASNPTAARVRITFEVIFHDDTDALRVCIRHARSCKQQDAPTMSAKIVPDAVLVGLIAKVTEKSFSNQKRSGFLHHCKVSFIGDAVERFHFPLQQYASICKVIADFEASHGRSLANVEFKMLPQHITEEVERLLSAQARSSAGNLQSSEAGAMHGGSTTGLSQEASQRADALPFNLPRGLFNVLLPYQKQALDFAINTCDGRVYIADDMGLGKTLEAISLSLHYSAHWPLLVITPSSLKHQWKNELEKWIPVLQTGGAENSKKKGVRLSMDQEKIAIIEKAADFSACVERETGKLPGRVLVYIISYSLASTLTKELTRAAFDIVICDEAHYLKGQDAKRSKAIKSIVANTSRIILLSGTPALSRPLELYQQLELLMRGKRALTFKAYGERYCTTDAISCEETMQSSKPSQKLQYARRFLSPKAQFSISQKDMYSGHSHLDELRWYLQRTVMIRRNKKEVLEQLLPQKKRSHILLKIEAAKKGPIKSEESAASIAPGLESWLAQPPAAPSPGPMEIPANTTVKKETVQLFYEASLMKVDAVCAYLAEYLQTCFVRPDDKVVIFAHHTEMLNRIESIINASRHGKGPGESQASFLGKQTAQYSYIRIDGTTPIATRAFLIECFQKQNAYKIALCSLLAVGVGVNFCAARTCIFAELYWTPAVLIQAEDRIHRLGQKGSSDENDGTAIYERSVEILYLIGQGTFDESLWSLVQKKFSIMSKMLENKNERMQYTMKDRKRIADS